MRQGGGGHKEADRQGGRHDKIRPRRDAGEYRRDRGGAFPGTERYRGRHRAYQLPRGGLHREHRPQDTRAPQYQRQAHLAADRRLRGGVLRGRRPGVPYGAQAGIYFLPHRAGHPVFQEGASRHQRGLQKIRHVPVRGRGQDGVRPGGRG